MLDDIKERAKLRASEERRAKHAYETLKELAVKHNLDEVDTHELYSLYFRLVNLIKNQHIRDADYARHKMQRVVVPDNDF